MIRKFLHKLFCWVRDYGDNDSEEIVGYSTKRRPKGSQRGITVSPDSSSSIRSNGMTFYMYAAEGGTVIETSFFNDKTDRNDNRLYIIPDGEAFSDTLGQIVSMERMRSWH